MIETQLAPGTWKIADGEDSLFVVLCDEGCSWMLSPDYPIGGWQVQHGENEEAVLRIPRAELPAPFDAPAFLARVDGWIARCHAYEAGATIHAVRRTR